MWVRLFNAIIPMIKQIMLEMKARTNQSNIAVRNSEDTATNITFVALFSEKYI
jgi:hypothetical protein